MKAVITAVLLILIIGNIWPVDIDSNQFIDHLRTIARPGTPEIFEDAVLFTAPSSFRRVGISFAHEGYAKVHWFRRFMIPRDRAELFEAGKIRKGVDPNRDSGIMFYVESIPAGIKNKFRVFSRIFPNPPGQFNRADVVALPVVGASFADQDSVAVVKVIQGVYSPEGRIKKTLKPGKEYRE